MRQISFTALSSIVLSLLISFSSCKNATSPDEKIALKVTRVSYTPKLSDSLTTAARALFEKNSLSLTNVSLYNYLDRSHSFGVVYVWGVQMYQGLALASLIDYDFLYFRFDSTGKFIDSSGRQIPKINIDLTPNVSPELAANILYHALESDSVAQAFYGSSYLDTCRFTAELVLFDRKFRSTDPGNFILAWKVKVDVQYPIPSAIVRADSVELVAYSGPGIVN